MAVSSRDPTHHLNPFSSLIALSQTWQYHRKRVRPFYRQELAPNAQNPGKETAAHTDLILLLIALVDPASARGIVAGGSDKPSS